MQRVKRVFFVSFLIFSVSRACDLTSSGFLNGASFTSKKNLREQYLDEKKKEKKGVDGTLPLRKKMHKREVGCDLSSTILPGDSLNNGWEIVERTSSELEQKKSEKSTFLQQRTSFEDEVSDLIIKKLNPDFRNLEEDEYAKKFLVLLNEHDCYKDSLEWGYSIIKQIEQGKSSYFKPFFIKLEKFKRNYNQSLTQNNLFDQVSQKLSFTSGRSSKKQVKQKKKQRNKGTNSVSKPSDLPEQSVNQSLFESQGRNSSVAIDNFHGFSEDLMEAWIFTSSFDEESKIQESSSHGDALMETSQIMSNNFTDTNGLTRDDALQLKKDVLPKGPNGSPNSATLSESLEKQNGDEGHQNKKNLQNNMQQLSSYNERTKKSKITQPSSTQQNNSSDKANGESQQQIEIIEDPAQKINGQILMPEQPGEFQAHDIISTYENSSGSGSHVNEIFVEKSEEEIRRFLVRRDRFGNNIIKGASVPTLANNPKIAQTRAKEFLKFLKEHELHNFAKEDAIQWGQDALSVIQDEGHGITVLRDTLKMFEKGEDIVFFENKAPSADSDHEPPQIKVSISTNNVPHVALVDNVITMEGRRELLLKQRDEFGVEVNSAVTSSCSDQLEKAESLAVRFVFLLDSHRMYGLTGAEAESWGNEVLRSVSKGPYFLELLRGFESFKKGENPASFGLFKRKLFKGRDDNKIDKQRLAKIQDELKSVIMVPMINAGKSEEDASKQADHIIRAGERWKKEHIQKQQTPSPSSGESAVQDPLPSLPLDKKGGPRQEDGSGSSDTSPRSEEIGIESEKKKNFVQSYFTKKNVLAGSGLISAGFLAYYLVYKKSDRKEVGEPVRTG